MLSDSCRLWAAIAPLLLIVWVGSMQRRLLWPSLDAGWHSAGGNLSAPSSLSIAAARRMGGSRGWRSLGQLQSWMSSEGSGSEFACASLRLSFGCAGLTTQADCTLLHMWVPHAVHACCSMVRADAQ